MPVMYFNNCVKLITLNAFTITVIYYCYKIVFYNYYLLIRGYIIPSFTKYRHYVSYCVNSKIYYFVTYVTIVRGFSIFNCLSCIYIYLRRLITTESRDCLHYPPGSDTSVSYTHLDVYKRQLDSVVISRLRYI